MTTLPLATEPAGKMIRKEEAELLQELPFKLRSRMLQALYADMLSRIPAVSRLPPHVLIELVAQLKPRYFVEGGSAGPGPGRSRRGAGSVLQAQPLLQEHEPGGPLLLRAFIRKWPGLIVSVLACCSLPRRHRGHAGRLRGRTILRVGGAAGGTRGRGAVRLGRGSREERSHLLQGAKCEGP